MKTMTKDDFMETAGIRTKQAVRDFIAPYFEREIFHPVDVYCARLEAWFADNGWTINALDEKHSRSKQCVNHKEKTIYLAHRLRHRENFSLLKAWFAIQWPYGKFPQDVSGIKYSLLEASFAMVGIYVFLKANSLSYCNFEHMVLNALDTEMNDLQTVGFEIPVYSQKEREDILSLTIRSVTALNDVCEIPFPADFIEKIKAALLEIDEFVFQHPLATASVIEQRRRISSRLYSNIKKAVKVDDTKAPDGTKGIYYPALKTIALKEGEQTSPSVLVHEYIHYLQYEKNSEKISPKRSLGNLTNEAEAILFSYVFLLSASDAFCESSFDTGYLYDLIGEIELLSGQKMDIDFIAEKIDDSKPWILDDLYNTLLA
ncbi:MAG: hypothetical protein HUJ55_01855 [Ileibacterium sp.]|nr:hypothetical protein [Ileibacterium sp.]